MILVVILVIVVVALFAVLKSVMGERPDGGRWARSSKRLGGPTVRGRDGKPLDPDAPPPDESGYRGD